MHYFVFMIRDENGEESYGALQASSHADAAAKLTENFPDTAIVKMNLDKLEDTDILMFNKEMYDAMLSEL